MTDEVLISTQDRVGRIRLNRPKAIHALTTIEWRAAGSGNASANTEPAAAISSAESAA